LERALAQDQERAKTPAEAAAISGLKNESAYSAAAAR